MATLDKLPSGLWRARIRRKGYPTQAKSFTRREDASGWARKIEREFDTHEWRDTREAERTTLRDLLQRYADEISPQHRGSDVERAMIQVMRDEPLCRRTLDKIDPADIRVLALHWRKQKEPCAIGTINRRLTITRAAFSTARRLWGINIDNPVAGVHLRGDARRERRVSEDEIKAIIDVSGSWQLAQLVRVAVESAMRRGEMLALTWDMVDLQTNVVHLSASITKAARARDVPLSEAAAVVLRERLAVRKGQRVFTLRPYSLTQAWGRAAARARERYVAECDERGVEPDPHRLTDLHFHDLRHEAASRLANLFGLHELMQITGHASSQMFARYYHPSAADFALRMRAAVAPAPPSPAARTANRRQ